MGSFSIHVNEEAKIMKVSVEGRFSPEDGMASIEAYHDNVAGIYIPDFIIDIDCTRLDITAPESLPHLGHCFELYKNDGFKKVILRVADNPIIKMQLKGVARITDLTRCEIIG